MMDAEQSKTFNELVLELIIDTHSPFNFVDRESFHRLVNFLRPGSSQALIGRHALASSRLNNRYNEAITRRDLNILGSLNAGHYSAFLVDGWETTNSDHIEGVILKLGCRTFLLTALQSGTEHDGQSTAREWEEISSTILVLKHMPASANTLYLTKLDNVVVQNVYLHFDILIFTSENVGRIK